MNDAPTHALCPKQLGHERQAEAREDRVIPQEVQTVLLAAGGN